MTTIKRLFALTFACFALLTALSAFAAPTVISHTYDDGSTCVLPTTTITATFSEAMDPATITSGSFAVTRRVGVKQVATGEFHTVALKNDGTVAGWGNNSDGQIAIPANLSKITAIATGSRHTVALNTDGTVVAWGKNDCGQATIPAGLSEVTAIAAGSLNTFALKNDGTVVAWGQNNYGQTTVPAGINGAIGIATGGEHTLVLKNDGTVVAWGRNDYGQTTIPSELNGVTAIAAGGLHSVALKKDGTVVAWGDNSSNQSTVPAGLNGVTAIAAGEYNTVALKNDGTVVAWGRNFIGENTVPTGLSGATAIATSGGHTVALKDDGTIVAWGRNYFGETIVPEVINRVTSVSAGLGHIVALKNDGTVAAWGYNLYGQAAVPAELSGVIAVAAGGDQTLALKSDGTVSALGGYYSGEKPTGPSIMVPTGLREVVTIAAGNFHSVALKKDGTVVAWGDNSSNQCTVPAGLSGVIAIAAQYDHSVALKKDGTVIGWGLNNYGQSTVPAGLSGVSAIAAGGYHTVALKNDGTVVAWGRNDHGQTTVPSGLDGVVAVAAGFGHSVALKNDGTIVAWGYNSSGQATVPAGLGGVIAIAAGNAQSVALKNDGTLVAWGSNTAQSVGIYDSAVSGSISYDPDTMKTTFTPSQSLEPGIYTVAITGPRSQAGTILAEPVTWSFIADNDTDGDGIGDACSSLDITPDSFSFISQSEIPLNSNITSNQITVSGINCPSSISIISGEYRINNGGWRSSTSTVSLNDKVMVRQTSSSNYSTTTTAILTIGGVNANFVVTTIPAPPALLAVSLAGTGTGSVKSAPSGITCGTDCSETYAYGTTVTLSATPNIDSRFAGWSGACSGTGACIVTIEDAKNVTATFDRVIAINDGNANTAVPAVTVSLNYPGATDMQLLYNGTWTTLMPFVATKDITLSPVYGNKTVAVRFKDSNGNLSDIYSDTILAAFTAPAVTSYTPESNATSVLPTAKVTATFSEAMDPATITSGSFTVTRRVGIKQVAAGGYHTVVLKNDGTVDAWGDNHTGQTTVPKGLVEVTSVAAGTWHSVALKNDNTVMAWGDNYYGQTMVPEGLSGVIAIAAGTYHTVALKNDGTVTSWGVRNDIDWGQATVPAALNEVTAIAAGSYHTVALKNDGTVLAWGNNDYGQTTVPEGLNGVIAIAAGAWNTVALKSDGTVVAWGLNDSGNTRVPKDLSGVTAIAAGDRHTVALKNDGTVVAWGRNDSGQATVPKGLSGVVAIAAGQSSTVVIKQDGTIGVWGINFMGQTSVPEVISRITAIDTGEWNTIALKEDGTVVAWGENSGSAAEGLSGVIAIAAGERHTVALKNDGTVVVWGSNYNGQATVPYGLSGVTAITAGSDHTVALKSDGTVVAWGKNDLGQCSVPEGLAGVTAVAAGYEHTVALKSDGTVVAWGRNDCGQTTVPAGLSGVIAIAAGYLHTVALKNDGTVVAWGPNHDGVSSVPAGLTSVSAIAAGYYHTVALKNDGTVVVWGDNSYGQKTFPPGLRDVTAIAAGFGHTSALKKDGTIVSWGLNDCNQAKVRSVSIYDSAVSGEISYNPDTLTATFTPNQPLVPGTYNVAITSPRSQVGVMIEAPVTWSFTVNKYPAILAQPSSVTFTARPAMTVSAPETLTIENSGTDTLRIDALSIEGTDSPSFALVSVPALPLYIAPGAVATFGVSFRPTSDGARTAYLSISSNSQGNALSVLLSGETFNCVAINNGADVTGNTAVTLTLHYPGATMMQLLYNGIWTSWMPFVSSKAIKLPTGDGIKSVAVRFKDNSGNLSGIYTRTILLSSKAPAGTITINDGAETTGSASVTLKLAVAEAGNITKVELSNDKLTWTTVTPFTTTINWQLASSGSSIKTVYARFTNAAGKVSPIVSASIRYGIIGGPPVDDSGSISINAGADFTASPKVTLTIVNPNPALYTTMRFSIDNFATWSAWEPAKASKKITLPPGDGAKTVWVHFMGTDKSEKYFHDGIVLDTKAPVGTILINGGAQFTTSLDLALTITAIDQGTVSSMQFNTSGNIWSDWESFNTSKNLSLPAGTTDGTKKISVRFKDASGKVSATVSDTITLDRTAPVGKLTINKGAAATNNPLVTLTMAAPGAVYMQMSGDGGTTWEEWEPYAASRKIILGGAGATRTVAARFRDLAGNTSIAVTDSIDLIP